MCGLGRADWNNGMYATNWCIVFLPLTLFWAGAWLRRSHGPVAWSAAGLLLDSFAGMQRLRRVRSAANGSRWMTISRR